jgi:holin-like protein
MIGSAAIVLCLMVLGDTICTLLKLPMPGAAVGLLMLSIVSGLRGGPDRGTSAIFDGVAPCIPLFFVPSAVGVIANLDMVASARLFIAVVVVVATILTMVVTGLIFQALLRRVQIGAKA